MKVIDVIMMIRGSTVGCLGDVLPRDAVGAACVRWGQDGESWVWDGESSGQDGESSGQLHSER